MQLLAVKPLLYACLGLVIVCGGLGARGCVLAADLKTARTERDAAQKSSKADAAAAKTWQDHATKHAENAAAHDRARASAEAALVECQAAQQRNERSNRVALEDAEVARREAERAAAFAHARYVEAMKIPACRVCAEAPICEALR